eukprot:scaffold37372_cov53-Phaeocystis_antarctica.AAC.5
MASTSACGACASRAYAASHAVQSAPSAPERRELDSWILAAALAPRMMGSSASRTLVGVRVRVG